MTQYYMPTKIIEAKNVVKQNKHIFTKYGNKALIVTGSNSSKKNGSLNDVTEVLTELEIGFEIYDKVVENPPVENIVDGAEKGHNAEFIIGVGGGSAIDAAKAIGILIQNPKGDPHATLFKLTDLKSIPIIAVPTTAGTGSETTPYSILTDHTRSTKSNFSSKVFPDIAFMDIRYFMSMPQNIRNNTCIDSLTHLIESYMCVSANTYSDGIVEKALKLWGTVKDILFENTISEENLTVFMKASTLAGMAISQTGTSLPHGLGYPLTYYKKIAHGKANGLVITAYLNICSNKKRVEHILDLLGFDNLNNFNKYLTKLIGRLNLNEDEILQYSQTMAFNKYKLRNHPDQISLNDLIMIYEKSL